MVVADRFFAGSVPEIYDGFLVPLIFDCYASDLAERLAAVKPREVLETAAGTGALTRAIASRLPAEARIVSTDLNQPMLDRAAAIQPHDQRIEWLQADALALPFEDQKFDAVACQFGVMFFPDKVLGYKEAHRVLRTGGHFLFNVWDQISENEFANVVMQALAALFPQNPPAFLARTPHGCHDVAKIRGDLSEAGFISISVETRQDVSLAISPRNVAIAYCQGTPLRNEIEDRKPLWLENATQASADALAKQFGTGPIQGRIRAHRGLRRRQTMKSILCASLLIILLMPSSYAAALPGDSADGKRLYDANCMGCHDTGIHTREDHFVQSLDALKKQVSNCTHNAKKEFSASETQNIIKYLNDQFYHFP